MVKCMSILFRIESQNTTQNIVIQLIRNYNLKTVTVTYMKRLAFRSTFLSSYKYF
jgi:hypothetical protein